MTASRRWRLFLLAGLSVLTATAGVVLLVFDFTYMPLGPGNETAPAVHANLAQATDGIQTTQWVIPGPTGSTATVAYMIDNTGAFGITVDGLSGPHVVGWVGSSTNPHSALLISLAWTPNRDGSFPVPMTLHAFPAHVPAGGSIAVDVTVTKPACKRGEDVAVSQVPIEWSAFGIHHTYDLPLQLGGFFQPINACPTRAALSYGQGSRRS